LVQETVKINYGISPDGNKEFNELPQGVENEDYKAHSSFGRIRNRSKFLVR
jgi:hypothetical protein